VSIVFAMIAYVLHAAGALAFTQEPKAPASPAEIVAYHDSGQWDGDIATVIRKAHRQVKRHLTDTRPALILDVDDTALSSYRCLKKLRFKRLRSGCGGPGRMPAIRQTRNLYDYARAHHVTVFFITGRRAKMRATTLDNLRRAGYTGTLHVRLRPNVEPPGEHDGWKARTRGAIQARGYTIVANVGDQRSDLDGGGALQSFKLPNPMYVIPTA
jgi:hypothetical protein